MLTILYILTLTTTPTAPASDPCAAILADSPELAGLAVDMAQSCQQDAARERLSLHVVLHGAERRRPEWAFEPMTHQPDLDAELAVIGIQVSPFDDDDDGLGPFAR